MIPDPDAEVAPLALCGLQHGMSALHEQTSYRAVAAL
jgi:hypothetical protein